MPVGRLTCSPPPTYQLHSARFGHRSDRRCPTDEPNLRQREGWDHIRADGVTIDTDLGRLEVPLASVQAGVLEYGCLDYAQTR
jgi:hypothetical protein